MTDSCYVVTLENYEGVSTLVYLNELGAKREFYELVKFYRQDYFDYLGDKNGETVFENEDCKITLKKCELIK